MKIEVWIRTNKIGSNCDASFEIDDAEWESMTEEEREDMCKDAAFSYLEWGWEAEERKS
ncbi:DUF7167 family protein [Pandoraea commovens]|uniref:DUF7167 domain-containing protein n=1 Tax=Pandoraea commovens TaxID=2508289 RepID=A0A5E4XCS5_9BURK|nr:hypothetical protein [Pandoraea commovens]VVE34002.1 hypothetical protein PCO31010_03818 [Pandoraea commovens]